MLPAVTSSGFISKKVKNHVFIHISGQFCALWMKIGENDRATSPVHEKKIGRATLKDKIVTDKNVQNLPRAVASTSFELGG